MKRLVAFLPLVALIALAAVFALWGLKHDPQIKPAALVGRPVPAVMLQPLDGGPPVNLRDVAKGPVLINGFASWCAPCRIEHPELMRLKAQGVRIIGIAWKNKPEEARGFLEEMGDPYDLVLLDPDNKAGIELGMSGVPETYVIRADGIIIDKWASPLDRQRADELKGEAATGGPPRR